MRALAKCPWCIEFKYRLLWPIQLHCADITVGSIAMVKVCDLKFDKARGDRLKLKLMKWRSHVLVVWNLEFIDLLEWPTFSVRCKQSKFLQVVIRLVINIDGKRGNLRRLFLA